MVDHRHGGGTASLVHRSLCLCVRYAVVNERIESHRDVLSYNVQKIPPFQPTSQIVYKYFFNTSIAFLMERETACTDTPSICAISCSFLRST